MYVANFVTQRCDLIEQTLELCLLLSFILSKIDRRYLLQQNNRTFQLVMDLLHQVQDIQGKLIVCFQSKRSGAIVDANLLDKFFVNSCGQFCFEDQKFLFNLGCKSLFLLGQTFFHFKVQVVVDSVDTLTHVIHFVYLAQRLLELLFKTAQLSFNLQFNLVKCEL